MNRTPLFIAALTLAAGASAQRLTSPTQFFGQEVGADYYLSNYKQFSDYWKKLDAESDRMTVQSIGKTAEGRDQLMAIVTAPTNHRRLNHFKDIAKRLAQAKNLTDEQARKLAQEGKAVVWIDGGLHATEVLGAQQLIETSWRMVSQTDPETMRILEDVIILFVHANPDGMDLVSDWYMRNPDPLERSIGGIPRLYQKYIGHDNNRDFYMVSQAESKNMNRVMYREWFPQIMYNHHQTGPAGTVMFAPPFRDPFNHNIDPLVIQSLEMVGSNIHRRMIEEGKPGTTMRTGASYSTWWNGGLRTTAYFHNIVGILTETIGSPTPMRIPIVPDRLVPKGNLPFPIQPQEWKFRQSIEYSYTANMSILDLASRYREQFLYNIYQAGRNSIAKGQKDTWTDYPSRVAQAAEVTDNNQRLLEVLRAPGLRDPRAYIIPADQADFPTAVKFVNTLIENGIEVGRAPQSFLFEDRTIPAGSLIIRCDQAFRPHIIDMFEPQDHPNDIPAPGAPPIAPYDNAGWTLAYQMGVEFVRVLDRYQGPYEQVRGLATPPAQQLGAVGVPAVWLIPPTQNDAYRTVNRLLAAGQQVFRAIGTEPAGNIAPLDKGTFWVPSNPTADKILADSARELGVTVQRPAARTAIEDATRWYGLKPITPARVGLWDRYGGSMPSGWTRFIFENFEVPFRLVFPQELDAGNLREKFDVLVFPDGAIPAGGGGGGGGGGNPSNIPQEFQHMLGNVTVNTTVPKLKEFLEQGGRIITIGSSTSLGRHLELPIENHLIGANGRAVPRAEYYVPGSILQVKVDNSLPVSWGAKEYVDVMFDNSPVFKITDLEKVKPIAWFDTDKPLRSGWAWGQDKLKDGVAMLEAPVGQGKVFLFGPELLFRSQPHGTFKFVFNAILNQ